MMISVWAKRKMISDKCGACDRREKIFKNCEGTTSHMLEHTFVPAVAL